MGLWEQERQLRHGPQVVCLSSWVEPGPETSVPATYKQSGTADSFLLTAPLSDVFPVSQLLTRNLKKTKSKRPHGACQALMNTRSKPAGLAKLTPASLSSSENLDNGQRVVMQGHRNFIRGGREGEPKKNKASPETAGKEGVALGRNVLDKHSRCGWTEGEKNCHFSKHLQW